MTRLTKLEKEVREIILYWQKVLRLLDWDMQFKVVDDPKDIECFASNRHHKSYQCCKIRVLNPKKIPPEWEGIRDLEVTLVHELLHTRLIYCTPDNKGTKHQCHEEMAIETLAVALVCLRRGITSEELV